MISLETIIRRSQLTSRSHARLMRDIHRESMERHKRLRLEQHFEEIAYSLYDARPRDPKYNQFKLRARYIGHIRPNVKSGRLKRAVMSRVKITATQHGAKLTTRGTTRSRLAAWQKREIAKYADVEVRAERDWMARQYKRGATSTRYKRKRFRRNK